MNNFENLQIRIAFFSDTVLPRNLKLFLYINIYKNTLCKKNFMFLGRTVFEKNVMITCKNSRKNAMLTCKISKLFIRTIVQLLIVVRYHRIFLENCATEELEIFFVF